MFLIGSLKVVKGLSNGVMIIFDRISDRDYSRPEIFQSAFSPLEDNRADVAKHMMENIDENSEDHEPTPILISRYLEIKGKDT